MSAGSTLEGRAIRGSVWILGGYGISQVLRFVANAVFSYLLYEEAFALMMIVNAIVQGLQMFSDVGLGPSVVQHRRGDDPRFLDTAFSMQVLRGFLLAALCLALTWPATAYYAAKDPAAADLERLLPFAALAIFVGGFSSTKLYTASRHLSLGRVTLLDLVSQVVGVTTTMLYAWWHRDVMALVLGNVAAAVAKTVGSHVLLPGHRNRFAWDSAAAGAIFRFGAWIFVSTAACFFAMQLDRLTIPSAFPLDESGVYSLAASLAVMVPLVIGSVQNSVVFPLYSRMLGEGRDVVPVLREVKKAIYTISGVLVVGIIAGCGPLIRVVYDDRWQAAGWMVAALSVGAWFQIVETLCTALLLANANVRWVAFGNAAKPVVYLVGFLLVGDHYGIAGAVVAWVVADVAKAAVALYGSSVYAGGTLGVDFARTGYVLLAAGVLWLLTDRMLNEWGCSPVVALAAGLSGALLAFAPQLGKSLRTLLGRVPVAAP
jgi:O-antigen/teichoic acid export membrane protein